MMAKEPYMRQLLDDGSDNSDDDWGLSQTRSTRLRNRRPSAARLLIKSIVFLLILVVTCMASFWAGAHLQLQSTLDSMCSKHTTQWSPVLQDVRVEYKFRDFNGSFLDEDIYRLPGSPEVDHAWEALGVDYRAGVISYEDGLASGLKPSFVQRADKYGGGFLVNVEGMHHLHCLNLLRKALYFNYDHYKALGQHAFKNEEHILRRHVTHCLDTVRQVLMCNVDTSVLGQVWVDPEKPTAFPDFNTRHVCKNYKDIQNWARLLQAPPLDEIPHDYLASPNPGDVRASTP